MQKGLKELQILKVRGTSRGSVPELGFNSGGKKRTIPGERST